MASSLSRFVKQWRQPISRSISKSFSTLWVEDFNGIIGEAIRAEERGETGDKHHWLFMIGVSVLEFDSHSALSDYYTRYVASVCNNNMEEAKKKIYLAGCNRDFVFGFGVCLDETSMIKLQRRQCPIRVFEDFYHAARPKVSPVVPQFTTKNQNRRLDNIFSYQRLSEPSAEWNSNYWLVTVRRPYGGFGGKIEATEFCVKILADVVGSEDAARKMIYMVWTDKPHGFAAKIDEDTLNKLKVVQDVMTVHPDYSFDVESDGRVIFISA